jgi:hypothetical protein
MSNFAPKLEVISLSDVDLLILMLFNSFKPTSNYMYHLF